MKTKLFSKRILSMLLSICMAVSVFAGLPIFTWAESTHATEIIYGGMTLNATTPYLVTKYDLSTGRTFRVSASDTDLASGEYVLAQFDASGGTLTYKQGMALVGDENAYEDDFAWDSYINATKIGDDYYGIKANGDLTIDLGDFSNFIYMNWAAIYTCNLYGIYADGDITINGDGYLKLPATLAMNMDASKGDADAEPHYSYGIYAAGDVNLNDGTVMIFSKNNVRWNSGTNANSVGVYAGGEINLVGTTIKFRYEESVGSATISHFNKTPVGLALYNKEAVTNIDMTSGKYPSLGYCYLNDEVTNNNCFNYYRPVPATGISLSRETLQVAVGESKTLTAKVLPFEAGHRVILWSTSDRTVATVADGVVTGHKEGVANIIAKADDGGFEALCRVTVGTGASEEGESSVSATGVTLDRSNCYMEVGDVQALVATVMPSTATNKGVSWSTNDENVATVSDGVVTAVGEGSAQITVTTLDGEFVDTCDVTVLAKTDTAVATEIIYSGQTLNAQTPYLVCWYQDGVGPHVEARATDALADGEGVLAVFDAESGTLTYMSGMELSNQTGSYEEDFGWKTYTEAWQIGNDFYGIRANGSLTVDLNGFNNFIYCNWNKIFTANLYGIYADGDVTIKGDGYLKLPATLAMNMDATSGDADAVPHYSYGIYATGAVNLDGGRVMIYSKNTNRENSGANAHSIGVHAGRYIQLGGSAVKFRYEESVGEGNITHFEGSLGGDYTKTAITNIHMASGDLHSLAHCYIGASVVNNNCFDYVSRVYVAGVTLDRTSFHLQVGAERTLVATVQPENACNKAVVWSSSDEKVATVSEGKVKAVAEGAATITATTVDGGFTATSTVVVSADSAGPASEIIYCGETLNTENPYLITWVDASAGRMVRAQADETLADGEAVIAYFDAESGTLTFKTGMSLATETGGYEADFGWNTYTQVAQIGEDYYGIWANGSLTVDLGPYRNFIYCNWSRIFACNLYGIYAEGDVTIKGSGYLKLPATHAMNLEETNGDANAEPHYSYGIYAKGNVYLDGGTVTIFSKTTIRDNIGSNANSVGVYADKSIYLNGTTLKFRYEEAVGAGKITYFSSTPDGNYAVKPITNIKLSGSLASLGFCYTDSTITNNNCFDYFAPTPATGVTLDAKTLTLIIGQKATLTATVLPNDATNKNIIWSSSNQAVAVVSGGVVTARGLGSATITAKTEDGGHVATCSVVVSSNSSGISLVVDGSAKALSQPIELSGDGVVYVPLVETFNHLGVTMTAISANVYTGKGNNGDIVIRVGQSEAEVDWVPIELPGPVYTRSGVVMVPAYLIEDAVKTTAAVYDSVAKTLTVASPDPDDVFSGYVDKAGAIINGLTTGRVVAKQSDFLVGSGKTAANSYVETSNVTVTIDGTSKTAVQLKSNPIAYGEVADGGAIYYRISMKGLQTFNEGDTGVIRFKARSLDASNDTDSASLQVLYERSSDWNKMGSEQFEIKYNEWNTYYVYLHGRPMGAAKDAVWPASKSQIKFNIGGLPQTIQIADFELIYYGQTVKIETLNPEIGTYHGMEADALWRKEALRRIEKHRKDAVEVTVVDRSGTPIQGAEIEIKQTESDFMFGVEVCKDEIVDLDLTSKIGQLRNDALDSFNMIVCGLEMKMDKVLRADGAEGIEMANEVFERGKRLRGHVVYWDTLANEITENDDFKSLSYEEAYRKIMDYTETYAYAFRGKLAQLDVINEIYNYNYIRTNFDTTRFYTDIFNTVHRIDPDVKLYINETHTQGKNKGAFDILPTLTGLAQRMKDEGAHIDGIGLQTHAREYFYPQGLYYQLDECAQVVDEVAITEFDFDNEYTENKTQYMIDNLISAFSHPDCSAFIVWGYNAPAHYEKVDMFYDMNWIEMPFKAAWDKMVLQDFRTNLSLTTDAKGRADFRGFHGDYEITVKYGDQQATIDFGLLKDADNRIEITIANGVYAHTSSGKYIETPTVIEYDSLSQAETAYRKEFGVSPYTTIALESTLKGVAAQSRVQSATTLSSDADYTAGKVWASSTGMSAVATDEATGKGVEFNNSASGSYTMSHLYTAKTYDKGNLEMSYLIETAASRNYGFALDMNFITSTIAINFGRVRTSTKGYYVETLGGSRINLSDNTIYNIQVALMQTEYPGVYDLRYTVLQGNEVVDEVWEKQKNVNNFFGIKGISVTAQANGAENAKVMVLREARVKFYTFDPLLTFSAAGVDAELLKDTLNEFDKGAVVETTSDQFLGGDAWGGSSGAADSFTYFGATDHLFAVRTSPRGEKILSRRMPELKSGEVLEARFDYYISAPSTRYNSDCYFDVRLESADKSVSRKLVSCTAGGLNLNLLGKAEGGYALVKTVDSSGISEYNKNNLHIVCTFTPNSTGGYDAALTLTNSKGVVTTVSLADMFTAEEFEMIDTFTIATATTAVGTNYGKGIAGIKNICLTKSGGSATVEDGKLVLSEGDTVGIRFNNTLARPFDAQLVLARYVDDKFSSMKIIDFNGRRDANGYLSIRVDKENEEENNFLLMLLDSDNALKPLKSAEAIVISSN